MFSVEGGIRVPAIVRWPGVTPAGRTTEQAAITMDWTATILGVTGTSPRLGVSARRRRSDASAQRSARRLRSDASSGERRRETRRAIGKWKYLRQADGERLFDLSIDPGEKNDLRQAHTESFQRIKSQYLEWNEQMLPRRQIG